MSKQESTGFEYCAIRPRCRSFAIGVCAYCKRPTCERDGKQISGPGLLYFTICNPCYAVPGRYEQVREQRFDTR